MINIIFHIIQSKSEEAPLSAHVLINYELPIKNVELCIPKNHCLLLLND